MQIEEAIEYLKMRSEKYKANKELMSLAENIYGAEAVKEYDKKQEAIETVLNELEKKDKRIKKIPDIEVIGDQKMWDINESNDPLTVTMFLKINELTDEINKLNERR